MAAAFMGPTVCELDGPMPIEKRSKAETYAVTHPEYGEMVQNHRFSHKRAAWVATANSRLSAPVAAAQS